MKYYILLPGDTEKDTVFDNNLLGEASFKTFYPGAGLTILTKMTESSPEILPSIRIITEKGVNLTIEDFLNEIKNLRVYR